MDDTAAILAPTKDGSQVGTAYGPGTVLRCKHDPGRMHLLRDGAELTRLPVNRGYIMFGTQEWRFEQSGTTCEASPVVRVPARIGPFTWSARELRPAVLQATWQKRASTWVIQSPAGNYRMYRGKNFDWELASPAGQVATTKSHGFLSETWELMAHAPIPLADQVFVLWILATRTNASDICGDIISGIFS